VANNIGTILKYDGTSGAFLGTFATGLIVPQDVAFGPDGNLYVTDGTTVASRVSRFDGATGQLLGSFVMPFSGGLLGPEGLAFGPGGDLYVASAFTNSVLRYSGTTGAFIEQFVPPPANLEVPMDLVFGSDGDLYVNFRSTTVTVPGGAAGVVRRYDGLTGTYIDDFVALGSGGLGAPRGGLLFVTSVPEPSSLALFGIGLAGLAMTMRRKPNASSN
jgi:DNA-binding beta-propeller fold protein YncE